MADPAPHAGSASALLGAGDPPPYRVYQAQGRSPYLLIADHAGQQVPQALAGLGLPQPELDRHIGWDIGIDGVTRELAQALDAFAITQTYSRLVIDCNRPLAAPGSIAEASDGTVVPGNQGLDAAARAARASAIFAPYHARIAAELDRRRDAGLPTILIAMHSFTPSMAGVARPWHAGVLYQRDARFAQALLAQLRAEPGLVVGDNQPYSVSDATDYAIPVHAEARGLAHVELEIRQDLIADPAGQRQWAQRLLSMLNRLQAAFTPG
ncbi:N-formylglutamate amidohydrolase [Xanthomonas sp. NCPPB 2654]|uniref:N-formylglutamate amidohydrolase n=1 Tax=unclassified Xanthomonas TaxID=2643310 RepID=UPI0021E0412A|nr:MULTISPECIES: N-formylglutamate amidohydrolase [unclassified Xanthomonas]MDL5367435.1 N-formylglutamate amidohydrolase [Xanthomonas sp. NCPPB 2654]UYC21698.1 N-formylglutamate amidohydrolase [Xanthomonas sp. CFBP 8443]